jgi:hypothetical protein
VLVIEAVDFNHIHRRPIPPRSHRVYVHSLSLAVTQFLRCTRASEAVRAHHLPFVVPRFPLTIAEWLNAIADAGLVLERADEPCASEETAPAHPEVADTRLAPYFLHLRARRLLLPTSAGPSEPRPLRHDWGRPASNIWGHIKALTERR